MKRSLRRKLTICLLGVLTAFFVFVFVAGYYFKRQWLTAAPNCLSIANDQSCILPFQWSGTVYSTFTEDRDAMLLPVSVAGVSKTLYMQFDTGSADTFLRSEAVKQLNEKGGSLELFMREDQAFLREYRFTIGTSEFCVKPIRVHRRSAVIEWDSPEAVNIIGTIGADLLADRVTEVDFSAREIRLHASRPEYLGAHAPFVPFEFQGRRVILPVILNWRNEHVHWDSGCSAFGLLTSAYHYDNLTDPESQELVYNANRHGDPVRVHHRSSARTIQFGSTKVPIRRISYADLYPTTQQLLGRFSGLVGFIGFAGNKCFEDSTLVLDTVANEYQLIHSKSR